MIYTTCKYAPEELFAGFGEETSRLDPSPASFSCADGCAHPNLCGFAKAVIEEVNAKGIRSLVFTDCCDAMRRTFDVLSRSDMDFLYFLPLPHKTGDREIHMFAADLKKLAEAYARASGKTFSREAAREACVPRTSSKTEESGEADPGKSSTQEVSGSAPSAYVSILGAHGGALLLEGVRETFSGMKVRDDTCSGNRISMIVVPESFPSDEAFFSWYAEYLLKGFNPCMRMFSIANRTGKETEILNAGRRPGNQEANLRGIIYHTVKFCDYYSFEYADLKQRTDLPLLKIETDTSPQSSGQLKTRIEAFAETLGVRTVSTGTKESSMLFGRQSGKNETLSPAAAIKFKENADFIAGIDSGSTSTDVVIMNRGRKILSSIILPTGMSASKSAKKALHLALSEAGIRESDLGGIVATGYGRDVLEMEKQTVTEITCHAKGAHFLFPDARTIVDIGGQDSKVIRIDSQGNVTNFIMNDKCAAGTGRFLEMQARALGLTMEEMSRIGLDWKEEVRISNMCTVFAESEVVSLVAKDTPPADIVHGLNRSVAAKTVSLIRRGKGEEEYVMTGGVSLNRGVVQCLSEELGAPVHISERSQLCGAIGAALIGLASAPASS